MKKVAPGISKETHTPIPGKAEIESLQNFQKSTFCEMKNKRSFLELVEQRVAEIEDTVIDSKQSKCNQ